MKLSTRSIQSEDRFNGFQQVIAHLGGMLKALVRHYPDNWAFHWRGICRAVLPEGRITSNHSNLASAARATVGVTLAR